MFKWQIKSLNKARKLTHGIGLAVYTQYNKSYLTKNVLCPTTSASTPL